MEKNIGFSFEKVKKDLVSQHWKKEIFLKARVYIFSNNRMG